MCKVCSAAESNPDFRILQNWWHIEAVFPPNPSYNIRQVMDLYVPVRRDDEGNISVSESLCFDLSKKFSGLKIFARNAKNNEIAFIESGESNETIQFKIHFKTDEFPIVIDDNQEFYHVKLELDYSLTPEDSHSYRSIIAPLPSSSSSQSKIGLCSSSLFVNEDIKGDAIVVGWVQIDAESLMQPEFYLTLPVGWECPDCLFSVASKNKFNLIDLEEPVISLLDGKKKYTYIPTKEGRGECNKFKRCVAGGLSMQITYFARMAPFFAFFCDWIPRLFLILFALAIPTMLVGIASGAISCALSVPALLSCAILTIAYYYTYITLRHHGYHFPENTKKRIASYLKGIVGILLVALFIVLLLSFFNIASPDVSINTCMCQM